MNETINFSNINLLETKPIGLYNPEVYILEGQEWVTQYIRNAVPLFFIMLFLAMVFLLMYRHTKKHISFFFANFIINLLFVVSLLLMCLVNENYLLALLIIPMSAKTIYELAKDLLQSEKDFYSAKKH